MNTANLTLDLHSLPLKIIFKVFDFLDEDSLFEFGNSCTCDRKVFRHFGAYIYAAEQPEGRFNN